MSRFFGTSDIPSYVLSFFAGHCVYALKLIAVTQVLDQLPLHHYPWLMLIQGILLYVSSSALENHLKRDPQYFFGMTMIGGLGLLALTSMGRYFPILEAWSFVVPAASFLLANAVLSALEVGLNTIVSSRTSILKNPHIATKLALAEEFGTVFGALLTLSLGYFGLASKATFFAAIPFVLALGFHLLTNKFNDYQDIEAENVQDNDSEKIGRLDLNVYPFGWLLVGLFTLLISLKHLQGFTVLIGIQELQQAGQSGVTAEIFSKLSLVQTIAIIAILAFSALSKNDTPTWSRGFKTYLAIQATSMVTLLFFPLPILYLATGALRKIWQHTFLEQSLNILHSSIPAGVRLTVRGLMERWGNFTGYALLAIFSFAAINGYVPMKAVWAAGALLAITGLWVRRKLFNTLTDYQVANIVRSDVYEAVSSCYSLANPEARTHAVALISLLNQGPRPIIMKAIIKSLAAMKSTEAIPHLIKVYQESPREDVQLAAIEALLTFKNHTIDLFLLRSLEKIIQEQTSLGELRRSVFTAITSRLNDVAIPMVLGILQDNPEDQRIIANALIVLGEIGQKRSHDDSIFSLMAPYLDARYTRRVRANVIMFLYHRRKFSRQAMAAFGTFLTSAEEHDRSAVAFLSGELRLKGMLPFVLDNSASNEHQNSTLLISLLKLGHPASPKHIAQLVCQGPQDKALTCLNQLSSINENATRYQVYHEVIQNHRERVGLFLELLSLSNRDFDDDRRMIRAEATRKGIKLEDDRALFLRQGKLVKAAA